MVRHLRWTWPLYFFFIKIFRLSPDFVTDTFCFQEFFCMHKLRVLNMHLRIAIYRGFLGTNAPTGAWLCFSLLASAFSWLLFLNQNPNQRLFPNQKWYVLCVSTEIILPVSLHSMMSMLKFLKLSDIFFLTFLSLNRYCSIDLS